MRTPLAPCAALCVALAAPAALAQPAPAQGNNVAAAAAAYEQAQQAQLSRDYARAASLFELADRAAPSPAALRSAIRNHQAAGQRARAATLALRARARDGADPQSAQLAESVLAESTPQLARVRVACAPECALTVDRLVAMQGRAASHELFVDPGAHTLGFDWDGRPSRSPDQTVTAGQLIDLSVEAPPAEVAPPPTPEPTPEPTPVVVAPPTPPPPQPPPRARRPLPPAVFWSGLAATAVAGGVLVWSGLDTLSARDAYAQQPTESGYNDGVGRETRTNVLIGVTAALGVATAVVGVFFTEWGGGRSGASAWVAPLPGGAAAGVVRSF
ncbi:MAG: hypothetical protein R3A52_24250 [Polyangiales bacterium]